MPMRHIHITWSYRIMLSWPGVKNSEECLNSYRLRCHHLKPRCEMLALWLWQFLRSYWAGSLPGCQNSPTGNQVSPPQWAASLSPWHSLPGDSFLLDLAQINKLGFQINCQWTTILHLPEATTPPDSTRASFPRSGRKRKCGEGAGGPTMKSFYLPQIVSVSN